MAREQRLSGDGTELGHFLYARRTQLTPEEVGLETGNGLRRTPGLRREELAMLAGISSDYYARLERGTEANPSPPVVDALARALRLGTAEHEHLRELVASAARGPAPQLPASLGESVRSGVELILENLRPFPAYVVNNTLDILACNTSALRLLPGVEEWPAKKRNIARYMFLHPAARGLLDPWDEQIRDCVAGLRALAGVEPDAPDLTRLVTELTSKSPEFADLWGRYEVSCRPHGSNAFHHPEVGHLGPGYQSMELVGTPGHRLIVYYAQPGTPDHDKMVLLDLPQDDPSVSMAPSPTHDS